MPLKNRLFAAAATMLLGSLLAAAISTPARAETVLNRGIGATISTLDPQVNFLATDGFILDDIYEGLIDYDANGQIVPGAAEKWDVSDDGLTYTFHLRDGLKWSNGEPLVAQDFANGIVRTIDPATASDKAYIFTTTVAVVGAADFNKGDNKDPASVGATAPDAKDAGHQARQAGALCALAHEFVLCPAAAQAEPGQVRQGLHQAGEHRLQRRLQDDRERAAVACHAREEPKPTGMRPRSRSTRSSTRSPRTTTPPSSCWQAGELDLTIDIPSDLIDKLKAEFGDQVHVSSSTESVYESFNLKKPPFDNPKLREALSLAIDRDALINKVVKGGYSVNCSYTIPIPNYEAPKLPDCAMAKADRVAKAKQLYAEAGFGPDKPLSLAIESTNSDLPKKMSETIAVMWKQTLGVDAKVHAQDRDSWLAVFSAGTWDVFNDDLVGDFAGPESYLSYMDPRAEAGYNWPSPEYEAAIDKALAVGDQAGRYKLLAEAEKILLDSYLTAPVAAGPNRHLVRSSVKGWGDNPPGLAFQPLDVDPGAVTWNRGRPGGRP